MHPMCLEVIKSSGNVKIHGCPMFLLSDKLKILKGNLKGWNHNTFGNMHLMVKEVEYKLNQVQIKIQDEIHSKELRTLEKCCTTDLGMTLHMENLLCKEKTIVNWDLDDDRNIRFFHKMAKIKQATKSTFAPKIEGSLITCQEVIGDHVVDHFKYLFIDHHTILYDQNPNNICIPHLINEETNIMLARITSNLEIKV